MIPKKAAQRLVAAGAVLTLGLLLVPQAGLAADSSSSSGSASSSTPKATATPSNQVTITITDSGFDQQSYSVAKYESPFKDMIHIINNGTQVHTVTAMPGQIAPWSPTCFPVCTQIPLTSKNKNKGQINFDTGGLAPGQQVDGGLVNSGTVMFTSATDCLFGNNNPSFNCTPASIKVKSYDSGSGSTNLGTSDIPHSLADTLPGTNLLPPTPDNINGGKCAALVTPQDGAPALCYNKNGETLAGQSGAGALGGSAKSPLSGNVTVTIDDVKGFDPAWVWVTPGTSITWVNNGARVHALTKGSTGSDAYNGYDPLESPGLAPGQSWTYNACGDPTVCKTDYNYQSGEELGLIDPTISGFIGKQLPVFVGEVTVVIPKS